MNVTKRVRVIRLCLASLCLGALLASGAPGSASARELLILSSKSNLHLVGFFGGSITIFGRTFTAPTGDPLVLVLFGFPVSNLDFRFRLLGMNTMGGLVSCNTPGDAAGEVLLNLAGHLGYADPGAKPAMLLSVPSGNSFLCGAHTVDVRGETIGEITAPELLKAGQSLLKFNFEQSEGTQKYTSFLLGSTLLTGQLLETNILGETNVFEKSALEASGALKTTEGTFELKD